MNQKQQKTAGIAALSIVAVLGVGIVTSHFMTNKSSNTPTKTSPYSHFRGRGGPGGFFSNPGTFAGGTSVTALHGTTITVSSFRGTTSNIVTTSGTTFLNGTASSTFSAIKTGGFVRARGATKNGVFTATSITLGKPNFGGGFHGGYPSSPPNGQPPSSGYGTP